MRVCFTNDFHGNRDHYESLGALLRRESPDLLILGGDMFPDGDGAEPVASQLEFVRDFFLPRIEAWKRAAPTLAVAWIPGNHDWRQSATLLRERPELIVFDSDRTHEVNGIRFLGFWHTPPTPALIKESERLDLPDDQPIDVEGVIWDEQAGRVRSISAQAHFATCGTLEAELAELPSVEDPWVFVCHAPPNNTHLDRLPNVDHPVGSKAIRRFIERRRPLISLHGHIHESPKISGCYHDRVDGVLCVNPGQFDDEFCAVLFDTDDPAATLRHTVFR